MDLIAERLAKMAQDAEGMAWLSTRPKEVQASIRAMPPGIWYRLRKKDAGLYTPLAYAEDGTVRVQKYDTLCPPVGYEVFGCHPEDFEPTHLTPELPLEELWDALW